MKRPKSSYLTQNHMIKPDASTGILQGADALISAGNNSMQFIDGVNYSEINMNQIQTGGININESGELGPFENYLEPNGAPDSLR